VTRFPFRNPAAAFAFFVGLTSAWLSGLFAPAEARVAEWLVPASDLNAQVGPLVGPREEDTRKIYEAVLRELSDSDAPDRLLIVRSETVAYPFTEGHARGFYKVSTGTLDDYSARHRLPLLVPPLHGLGASVTLLGWDEEPASMFCERKAKRWEAFHRKFPQVPAHFELSPVGFNLAGDEALVYAARNSGGSCGEGGFLLLRKSAGQWQMVCKGLCVDD